MAKLLSGGFSNHGKCSAKFTIAYAAAEAKAGPGVCPVEGDAAAIENRVDEATDGIASALASRTARAQMKRRTLGLVPLR